MNTSDPSERQSSQSSARLLQILECLAENRMPMRLQDISKQVGMTQSTVLRYLYTLQATNYIYQESSTLRYALTWRVCKLSENVNSLLSLRNITTPFINHLANTLSLGTCLVINQNDECLYLDCIDNPNSPTLQRIGKAAPLHATGSGKVLLSQYPEAKLNAYILNKGLTKYTDYTITDPVILKKELESIRNQGFGMDEQECEIGLRCISIPLYDYTCQVIASMSIFGNTSDMTDQRIRSEVYPALREATTTISLRLGYIKEQQ